MLAEVFASCLGSGYRAKLVEYPMFDRRLHEALPPANCCVSVGEPGPVLNDGIRDELFEGRRNAGLDSVPSRFAKSQYYERPLYAKPRRCGGENCWGYDRKLCHT